MTRYIDETQYPVTCPFGVARPMSATGKHEGEDRGCPRGTPLFAPESGKLQLAVIRQNGDGYNPDLLWPDGSWWPYSRYYEWWAGGLAILWGERYTHVFLHIDPSCIYEECREKSILLSIEKKRDRERYDRYVISEVVWNPVTVGEGNVIAKTGISGFDDGSHVHYQVMKGGKNEHVVLDPRTVWGGEM